MNSVISETQQRYNNIDVVVVLVTMESADTDNCAAGQSQQWSVPLGTLVVWSDAGGSTGVEYIYKLLGIPFYFKEACVLVLAILERWGHRDSFYCKLEYLNIWNSSGVGNIFLFLDPKDLRNWLCHSSVTDIFKTENHCLA